MIDLFYGDPHLGHKLPRLLEARGFTSVEEHDATLIGNYNIMVGTDDVVLWMGDDFFCSLERAKDILAEMAGRKLTMVGNHDRSASWLAKAGFEVIVGEMLTQIENRVCRVSHYPYFKDEDLTGIAHLAESVISISSYPKKHPGEVLIHGHTHSSTKVKNNCVNVCVEAWDNYPASYNEVAMLVGW